MLGQKLYLKQTSYERISEFDTQRTAEKLKARRNINKEMNSDTSNTIHQNQERMAPSNKVVDIKSVLTDKSNQRMEVALVSHKKICSGPEGNPRTIEVGGTKTFDEQIQSILKFDASVDVMFGGIKITF